MNKYKFQVQRTFTLESVLEYNINHILKLSSNNLNFWIEIILWGIFSPSD
jgi:hypothetical protein